MKPFEREVKRCSLTVKQALPARRQATYKRTQHFWPTTPDIVGCYKLRPFAHPVTCCCAKLKPVKHCKQRNIVGQQLPTLLRPFELSFMVFLKTAYCIRPGLMIGVLNQMQTDTTTNVGSWVRLHVAKSLTGFKVCATTPNNTQQHATGCATGRNM